MVTILFTFTDFETLHNFLLYFFFVAVLGFHCGVQAVCCGLLSSCGAQASLVVALGLQSARAQ